MSFDVYSGYPIPIKIAKASESRLEIQKNKLTASQLDLELETRVIDVYITHRFESQLRDRVKDMSCQLCALTQHVELQCTPVITEAALGGKEGKENAAKMCCLFI